MIIRYLKIMKKKKNIMKMKNSIMKKKNSIMKKKKSIMKTNLDKYKKQYYKKQIIL